MRTVANFTTPKTTASVAPTTSLSATSTSTITPAQRSPWHSPVPYLFGGIAAMLGLIVFALLILACSYWKLSGRLENRERDLESSGDEKEGDSVNQGSVKVYEENILVTMAGDKNPTFLATPVGAKASYLGTEKDEKKEIEKNENCEKLEKEMNSHDQASVILQENRETQEQNQ
ncbi:Protein GLUTAMINE DUMPER like [Quillaja saponaria]|uniref:Protein GLUTAMINE DUMPER like n=1 Tax=Quillaja saponaria TaxID=32244 RepID=A0AAD7LXU9_QUISA|nr:Protein GLUTAMINE DUMPER like [Quillaja saponaria]